MAFQAEVGTWIAVHLLVRMPVGGRFGINNTAIPVGIRLETGDGLDDIELSQSDGGAVHVQCKTSANLSSGPKAPLAKTIGQLARWVADAKAGGGIPDLNRNVAVLAVRADAARTLDTLESGCRSFDLGGNWATTVRQRNQSEQTALSTFELIANAGWTEHRKSAPGDGDLADMARIFRIVRFSMDEGDSDWREASQLLGLRLFGHAAAGDAPLRDLRGIVRDLIESGAPADRDGLLRALRRRGHQDTGAPEFEHDLARLRAVSAKELARLGMHGRLPLGAGVPIARECEVPLQAAILAGSMLVCGEPGAGKTGALVRAAATLAADGNTVVFLSVDRFPGVATSTALAAELGLTHSLLETLAAVPGAGRKILIVDALDAARGGLAEAVFAALVEDAGEQLAADWAVIASIRTFDLQNGRRFRAAFPGNAPNTSYVDKGLANVRHFLIPRLSAADLVTVGNAARELGRLLGSAPPRLVELLRNVFNLSLAAELLASGAAAEDFRAIRSQSGLIDAYEDARLNTTARQQAAGAAAAAMTASRRLSVRKMMVSHAAIDEVIQAGVLTSAGDVVSFAHHVLFDHVTGRFHLAWDDPQALLNQISGDASAALLLAPALRFAVERMWRMDAVGHPLSWQFAIAIFSASRVDPVLSNVALRVLIENVETEEDIAELAIRVASSPTPPQIAAMLARLSRYAAIEIEAAGSVAPGRALAWSSLANALAQTSERALIDPANVLLLALFRFDDLDSARVAEMFGQAARALLERAWAEPSLAGLSSNTIRYVGRSFASNPKASRALLSRSLVDPHFSQHADREAQWLAEQILRIVNVDPEFAIEIYRVLYGSSINDDATSWIGGQRSRILPLSSNRRQDFEHSRWHLGKSIGEFLKISPYHGTRAVIEALIGASRLEEPGGATARVRVGAKTVELRGRSLEINAWEAPTRFQHDDDLLGNYVRFLRECDVAAFAQSVHAASQDYAISSVWAGIFGVGSERIAAVGEAIWPLVEHPDFLKHEGTARDAIRFVTAAWKSRTKDERKRFELMALAMPDSADDGAERRWVLGRVLALLPADALESQEMRDMRRALEAENSLRPNDPLLQVTSSWGDSGIIVRDELRRAGINPEDDSYREVLNASEALYVRLNCTGPDSSTTGLAKLWKDAMALVALSGSGTALPDELSRQVWGHVSNVMERIASSSNYTPGIDGLPGLQELIAVIVRLSSSPYPRPAT